MLRHLRYFICCLALGCILPFGLFALDYWSGYLVLESSPNVYLKTHVFLPFDLNPHRTMANFNDTMKKQNAETQK